MVSVDTHVSPRLQRGSAHWGRNDLFFPGPFPALLALDESVHVTFCFCEKTHQNATCQSRAVWPPLCGLGPWAAPRVHPEASPLLPGRRSHRVESLLPSSGTLESGALSLCGARAPPQHVSRPQLPPAAGVSAWGFASAFFYLNHQVFLYLVPMPLQPEGPRACLGLPTTEGAAAPPSGFLTVPAGPQMAAVFRQRQHISESGCFKAPITWLRLRNTSAGRAGESSTLMLWMYGAGSGGCSYLLPANT